jgi:hypothetical protein
MICSFTSGLLDVCSNCHSLYSSSFESGSNSPSVVFGATRSNEVSTIPFFNRPLEILGKTSFSFLFGFIPEVLSTIFLFSHATLPSLIV